MADLPQERCNKAAPLSYCGVDMFEPLIIKERRSELKCYSALFIGFSSRASLHVKYRQKKNTQTNKITQLPDTSIPESTWEYKITNSNNKYTCKTEN